MSLIIEFEGPLNAILPYKISQYRELLDTIVQFLIELLCIMGKGTPANRISRLVGESAALCEGA